MRKRNGIWEPILTNFLLDIIHLQNNLAKDQEDSTSWPQINEFHDVQVRNI